MALLILPLLLFTTISISWLNFVNNVSGDSINNLSTFQLVITDVFGWLTPEIFAAAICHSLS